MGGDKIPLRNAEGYVDPTAHEALNNAMKNQRVDEAEIEERINLLIKTLKNTIRLAGFELVSRIEVRDTKSGRIFR